MLERDGVDVEAALGVHGLARPAQLQQIEDRLHVGIEAVVALAGEGEVAVLRASAIDCACSDRGRFVGDAVPGRLLAVVVLVVLRRRVTLVVRRHDPAAEARRRSRCASRPWSPCSAGSGSATHRPRCPITPRYDCRIVLRFR